MTRTDHVAASAGKPHRAPCPILGRDEDLATLAPLTTDPQVRLVTLIGPAGVGKTRLAAEHLARETAQGRRHTLFVPLDDVETLPSPEAATAACHGRPGAAARTLGTLWARYGGLPLLLVLDGVDRFSEADGLLEQLLSGYPRLHVVTTSVRPLHRAGDQVLRVRPLPATGSAAVALFVRHASEVDAGFRATDEVLADVSSICRSVGGLPLAIELAAARVGSIPPAVMARQLAECTGIRLLHADHPQEDDDMEATLDWAFGLLDEAELTLLTQLSVLEEPFGLGHAAAVAAPTPNGSVEMLDRLSALVELQLLDVVPGDPASPHFALSPLVRGHAARHRAETQAGARRGRVTRPAGLEELLELAGDGHRGAGHLVVCALATDAIARGDLVEAARHVHGALVATATGRHRDPLVSLVSLALLVSVAVGRGDGQVAARLLIVVEPFEAVLAFTLPRDALRQFARAADRVRSLPAAAPEGPTGGPGLPGAVALAQTYTRSVLGSGRVEPDHGAASSAPGPATAPPLTARERDVLVELATGGTNKEIAEALGLTAKTVMHHSMSIYRKLGVRGRGEATCWAFRHGLTGR